MANVYKLAGVPQTRIISRSFESVTHALELSLKQRLYFRLFGVLNRFRIPLLRELQKKP